jgi:ATP/maltotriose-dependent transcriptional regulator MalT/two-component SAPR family response regulator
LFHGILSLLLLALISELAFIALLTNGGILVQIFPQHSVTVGQAEYTARKGRQRYRQTHVPEAGKIVVQLMIAAEIPLSRTKIIVPTPRPEILHRARLLALFDDLLDKKLIIIAAPAGYGKTSLLVDFARQSEMPVCWLSLDALDKDPQRFCAYLIAALEQRFPKFGKQSNAVLRSLTNLEADSERLLSALVNEIDGQIGEHFTLVMDDYQCVDTIASVRDLFSRFVYLAGENCHVVLSSRRLPTLPDITLMVAHQQVSGFDLEQLAFRPDEIRALFEMDYGMTLADSAVEELMQQTEGWITGLHLSAGHVARGVPDLTRAARTAGVDLASYLDQQVLTPQPPKLRKFLLQTSLLEEFDADLCGAVLGKGDWKSLIKTVRQDSLFVLSVGPNGKWLRYHHLFQEFLQERIREEEPERAQVILLRLAEVYKERHEWEKAYALYRQSGNPNLLADLVELAGTPMLLSEHLITLQTWLEELPASLLEKRPSLLSLKGALLCGLGEGRTALKILNQAIPGFQKVDDLPGLVLAHVRRAAAYRLVGDYASSLQDSDEALRLSENKPNLEVVYAEAERFKGISLYHLGKIAEAARFLEEALRYYEQLGEEQSIVRVQTELGMIYRANGNYVAARLAYEQALAKWRDGNGMPSQAIIFNSLGVLYHYQGEYEKAVQIFEAGLEYVRQNGPPWQESLLLTSLGDMYTDLDEYESAGQLYNNATEIARRVGFQFLTNYLSLAQAHLARLRGQTREAYWHLHEAEVFVQATGSNYERSLFYLEHGCLRLIGGNYVSAVTDLERALDYSRQGSLVAETARSQVWLAAAHLGSGEVAAARAQLHNVLGVRQPGVLFHPLLQAIRQARPQLVALQEDAGIGPALTTWLESIAQTEAQLPTLRKRLRRLLHTVPIQAPHLTIKAFGKPRMWVNGKLVTSAQWKTASVRELFFYVLAASRPLTKEEIGETLWPELDASQLKLRFKNEMYRLRHALGQDVILFENDHYHFNRLLDYEYDVENFAAQLIKAKAAVQIEEKIAHLRTAISLRGGPYLQDVDATWVWPERERLDQTCVDALEQLAEDQRKAGDRQAALQACQEALKIGPCREDIHCLAMQLHAEQGDRLAVIWQYQACRDALRAELEVDPSEETDALYRQLVA